MTLSCLRAKPVSAAAALPGLPAVRFGLELHALFRAGRRVGEQCWALQDFADDLVERLLHADVALRRGLEKDHALAACPLLGVLARERAIIAEVDFVADEQLHDAL